MFFSECVSEFLEEQQYKGNSKSTITYYKDRIAWYQNHSQIKKLKQFTEASVRRWLMSYEDISRNTLANYDRALRVFANWLYRRGYVPENPMGKLPKPKEQSKKLVTFTPLDVKAMLTEIQRRHNPLRDKALLMTLLDTGIRRGEISTLTLGAINWVEDSLFVTGKTGERIVPVGRKAKHAVKRYIDRD